MSLSQRVFDRYKGADGFLDSQHFGDLCYSLGHPLTADEIALALKRLDENGDRKISYQEFLVWWRAEDRFGMLKMSDSEQQAIHNAVNYFEFFDKDRSGVIDRQEFVALWQDLKKNGFAVKEHPDICLADLDSNNDNQISLREYLEWLVRIGSLPQHTHAAE